MLVLPGKVNSPINGFSWKIAKKPMLVLCEGTENGSNRRSRHESPWLCTYVALEKRTSSL